MTGPRYQAILDTPIDKLGIRFADGRLLGIEFLGPAATPFQSTLPECLAVCEQLQAYFHNPHYRFSLPYTLVGTDFQKRVWHALTEIPTGQTLTYGTLAKQLNSAPRAVGQACRRNPLPILIPCHRIVSNQGLGGFSGQSEGQLIDVKQWLLAHEQPTTKIITHAC